MKKLLTVINVLLVIFAFTTSVFAETKTTVTGQIRVRGESTRKTFDSNFDKFSNFTLMRTRINITSEVDENATAFIQLQDSRKFGATNQFGNPQATFLNDSKNVDLHQAFIKYKLYQNNDMHVGVLLGRFEFNWANQRLFGAVGWHNVGRSWEGGLLWYDNPSVNFTFGNLKVIEDADSDPQDTLDYDTYVIMADIKKANLKFILTSEQVAKGDVFNRGHFAFYYTNTIDQFDFELTGASQFGDVNGLVDFAGTMFGGEIGFSLNGNRNGRVAIALDVASGDDGTTVNKDKTFYSDFWTGHKFNGYMDYFLSGGPNGLIDLIFRGKFDFTRGWTLGADLHIFSAAEEYIVDIDPTPATNFVITKDVGSEIDIFVKTNRVKGVALQWGLAAFTAKDNFASYYSNTNNKRSGIWAYSQTTLTF